MSFFFFHTVGKMHHLNIKDMGKLSIFFDQHVFHTHIKFSDYNPQL